MFVVDYFSRPIAMGLFGQPSVRRLFPKSTLSFVYASKPVGLFRVLRFPTRFESTVTSFMRIVLTTVQQRLTHLSLIFLLHFRVTGSHRNINAGLRLFSLSDKIIFHSMARRFLHLGLQAAFSRFLNHLLTGPMFW